MAYDFPADDIEARELEDLRDRAIKFMPGWHNLRLTDLLETCDSEAKSLGKAQKSERKERYKYLGAVANLFLLAISKDELDDLLDPKIQTKKGTHLLIPLMRTIASRNGAHLSRDRASRYSMAIRYALTVARPEEVTDYLIDNGIQHCVDAFHKMQLERIAADAPTKEELQRIEVQSDDEQGHGTVNEKHRAIEIKIRSRFKKKFDALRPRTRFVIAARKSSAGILELSKVRRNS